MHTDYVDQQEYIHNLDDHAIEYNDDYVGIASFNIFVGVYVATIFGAAFFFDLFWPERHESRAVRLAWKICSVLACVMVLATALALTIITATHEAYVTGVNADEAETLLRLYGGSPLEYRHNGRAVAAVVFIWLGLPATVASTVILWMSHKHDDEFGPKSKRGRAAMTAAPAKETSVNSLGPQSQDGVHEPGATITPRVSGYTAHKFSPYNVDPPHSTQNSSQVGLQHSAA